MAMNIFSGFILNNLIYIFSVFYIFSELNVYVRCGRLRRVIGGYQVECGSEPRVTSLQNSTTHRHLCGATLISADFAITAAHCVPQEPWQYKLRLNNYCNQLDGRLPQADVLDILIHHNYNRYTLDHDIAILKIKLNIKDVSWLQDNILPKSSFGISGSCRVYGYGITTLQSAAQQDHLKVGRTNIVSLDRCVEALGAYVAPAYDGGMMCATGDHADSCQGDSGGPLLCGSESTLEGIVSYGQSCAVENLPAVYASIGAHRTWITTITGL